MKLSILGLSSLLQVPGASFPKLLAAGFSDVMIQLVNTLARMQHWEEVGRFGLCSAYGMGLQLICVVDRPTDRPVCRG